MLEFVEQLTDAILKKQNKTKNQTAKTSWKKRKAEAVSF